MSTHLIRISALCMLFTGLVGGSGVNNLICWGASYSATQEAYVTLVTFPTDAEEIILLLKGQRNTITNVSAWTFNANGGRIGLWVASATMTLDDFGDGSVP